MMAVRTMSTFWNYQNDTIITIPSAEEIANVTYFKIVVTVADVQWTVKHRYSEFYELHNQLVSEHGVSKDILPSKKVIRNKCPIFIESRRKGLEEYLQKVLVYLKRTMPPLFLQFLNFNLYDIYFLLEDLAKKFFLEADHILNTTKSYSFTPIELHAISSGVKQPFPAERSFDISPIMDLCSQLEAVTLNGSSGNYRESNIIPNKLPFDLTLFKSLKCLITTNICLDSITSLGSIRETLEKFSVNGTKTQNIFQILQCDVIHKFSIEGSQQWKCLEKLDLSKNNLTEIDQTISLAPNLKSLILNNNKISTITNLSDLPSLQNLQLSNNLLNVCTHLHTKLGNIKSINLSQNNITSLKGFGKLYSLEVLDLSCNKITDIEEISYIGDLPCLEQLILTGNGVATTVDYRIKVLEYFGNRAKDICLDNEKPSQSELDKVSVLRVIRIVKEGRTPNLTNSFSMS